MRLFTILVFSICAQLYAASPFDDIALPLSSSSSLEESYVRIIRSGALVDVQYPLSDAEHIFEDFLNFIRTNVHSSLSLRLMSTLEGTEHLNYDVSPALLSLPGNVEVTVDGVTGSIFIADVLFEKGPESFEQGVRWATNPRVREQLDIIKQLAYVAAERGELQYLQTLLRHVRDIPNIPSKTLESFYESLVAASIRCGHASNIDSILGMCCISKDWGVARLAKFIQLGSSPENPVYFPPYALAVSFGYLDVVNALDKAGFKYVDSGSGSGSALVESAKRVSDGPALTRSLLVLMKKYHPQRVDLPSKPLSWDVFLIACLNGNQGVVDVFDPFIQDLERSQQDFTLLMQRSGYYSLNRAVTYAALGGHRHLFSKFMSFQGSVNLNVAKFLPVLHIVQFIENEGESDLTSLSSHTCQQALTALQILSEHGADFDVRNDLGRSALHIAVQHYKNPQILELVDFLISHGCPAYGVDHTGKTPWTLLQEMHPLNAYAQHHSQEAVSSRLAGGARRAITLLRSFEAAAAAAESTLLQENPAAIEGVLAELEKRLVFSMMN